MALLVRTWNVFHGNADPPVRRGFLRQMVELATADDPGVVCLQELPVWALGHLEEWSGYLAFTSVARPPRGSARLAEGLTSLHLGVFRSGLAGQANAILVSHDVGAEAAGETQISDPGRERRTAHAARLDLDILAVNLHATNAPEGGGVQQAELDRARAFAEELASAGEAIVLAGDFNTSHPDLPGYSAPAEGIDHVLVRGAASSAPRVWPLERRTLDGVVLSDHPLVEVTIS